MIVRARSVSDGGVANSSLPLSVRVAATPCSPLTLCLGGYYLRKKCQGQTALAIDQDHVNLSRAVDSRHQPQLDVPRLARARDKGDAGRQGPG